MVTNKRIKIARTEFTAVRAGLRSHIWAYKLNNLSCSFRFILDKALQLIEAPTIEPSVQSLAHMLVPTFTDSIQIFQDDTISISNNLFADVVVYPSHITFLPTRRLLEQPFSRLRAFSLKFLPQILELHNLGFMSTENLAITCDCKVIYSDINTNNLCSATVDVDISGECDMQEIPVFPIFDKVSSLVFPIKIFPIIQRNIDRKITPIFAKSKPNFMLGKTECPPVKPDRTGFEGNSFVTGLIRFKSFGDSIYRKLCLEIKLASQVIIDKLVQCKLMFDVMLNSIIRSILTRLFERIRQFIQFFTRRNLNFDGSRTLHSAKEVAPIYKLCGVKWQFIPRLKSWVSLPYVS